MARPVLTDEERGYLKAVAVELIEIRKLINQLVEAMAKLNDKQLLKAFNEDRKDDVSERQIDNYQLALEKKVDATKSEFQL